MEGEEGVRMAFNQRSEEGLMEEKSNRRGRKALEGEYEQVDSALDGIISHFLSSTFNLRIGRMPCRLLSAPFYRSSR